MRRRLLGILFVFTLAFGSLLSNAPVVYAGASGNCIADPVGCTILVVVLNPAPPTNATVTATRQPPPSTDDNSFTLDPISPGRYTSSRPIWGTSPSDGDCASSGDTKYFDISVTGSATGSASRVNMCHNQSPQASMSTNEKIIPIPVALAGSGKGGVKGHVTVKTPGGAVVVCPAGSAVSVSGPTNKDFAFGGGGNFDSGMGLDPSVEGNTYRVEVSCAVADFAGAWVFEGVEVKPNEYTVLNVEIDQSNPQIPPPDPDKGVNVPATCNAGPYFSWLICDLIVKPAVSAIDWVRDNILVPLLEETPMDNKDPRVKPIYDIWAGFRNVASLLFILVFFLVIIGNAVGFDNYTIKKILPRLVAGAVLIPFSWWLCVMVIDVGNILGNGLVSLSATVSPPTNINFESSLSKLVLAGLLIGVTGVATTALATLGAGVLATVVIAIFVTLFTLILRKILITLCVVLSPFALLLWILPNTEKWFKEWWSNFLKLVLMFPLIMLLFEAGRIFSAAAGAAPVNGFEKGVTGIIQFAAVVLPLFLVPATFKMAGSGLQLGGDALRKAGGAMDKRYGKDSEKAKLKAADRKAINANRAMDALHGPGKVTFGRKLKGAVALKRSGLGGFAQGAGKKSINHHKQMKINQAQAKYQADQGLSEAQDQFRRENDQTSKEAIRNETAGIVDADKEAKISQAESTAKNADGTSIRNMNLTEGSDAAHQAKIAEARAEFAKTGSAKSQAKLAEVLGKSDGGIDNLEGMIHQEVAKGDKTNHAVVSAALKRMSNSYTGFQRAQDLAMGSIAEQDIGGGKIKYKGGNGTNADGSKSLFGGNYTKVVDDKWRDTWNRGTKDAPGNDKAKPMTSAGVDMSAEQLAGTDAAQIRRYLAFYDQGREPGADPAVRKAANKGAQDFSIASNEIKKTAEARGAISTETKATIAKGAALRQPVVSEELAGDWGVVPTRDVPTATVGRNLSSNIVAATGNDLQYASQVHAQIVAERAAHPDGVSATHDELAAKLLANSKLERADIEAAGVAATAAATQGDTAVRQKMAQDFKDNLDHLHEVEQHYVNNEDYRKLVKDAYLRGRRTPGIPE